MSLVRVEADGSVAVVTLARPERRNALTSPMVDELLEALGAVSGARAVVLAADGPSFCAGQDLDEVGDRTTEDEARDYLHRLQEVPRRMRALPAPIVGAVQGHALGAGMEIALACDLVVCEHEAVLGLPEVAVGLAVGGAATALLPRLLGLPRAAELVLLGRRVGAAEAVQLGLANELHASPLQRARDIADVLATLPAPAVAWAKRSLVAGAGLEEAYALEVEAMLATGAALQAAGAEGGA